eukprot:813843-Ditylum_brightwellii.AAC.1
MQSKRPGPVLIVSQLNNKTDIKINYKNPYTPYETLGHVKAHDRGDLSQKAILPDNAECYAIKALTSSLTH